MRIAIIGSGFGGLGMGIELRRHGHHDFTIFEKASSVGGTWRANTYPGAECDIPTSLYSFSFEPYDWPCKWSHQPVIRDYLEHCADRYDLRPHLRFDTSVTDLTFHERDGTWTLRTHDGGLHAFDAVVCATGQLSRPRYAEIPGRDRFEGPQFHSAEWDHDADLSGHVAVIGNGASAAQFVPEIARDAEQVTIFQRTPNWMIPKRDKEYSERALARARRVPLIHKARRAAVWFQTDIVAFNLMRQRTRLRPLATRAAKAYLKTVTDPETRRKLTPEYPIGARRILFTDTFYEAVEEHGIRIVTEPITAVTPDGLRTADGVEHRVDAIVHGTGFHTNDFLTPMRIVGRDGRRLDDDWRHGAEAHVGITVSGYPNLFFLYGPNTNLGHTSIVLMLEAQIGYVRSAIEQMDQRALSWIDVWPDVQRRYNHDLQRRLRQMAWVEIADSWYLTEGKVTNNWAGRTTEYKRLVASCDLDDYEQRPRVHRRMPVG